jgi:4-hydroxy-4-methyl-2-oxoglutarate aldolase
MSQAGDGYADELRGLGVATLHEANHRRGLMTGLALACLGELIAPSARALGMVIDDAICDIAQLDEVGFPIASRGITAQGTIKRRVIDLGETLAPRGVAVGVGDWVVADRDGVVAIAGAKVGELTERALQRLAEKELIAAALDQGRTTVEVLALASGPRP